MSIFVNGVDKRVSSEYAEEGIDEVDGIQLKSANVSKGLTCGTRSHLPPS